MDMIACIDEAGAKGFSRNLAADRDPEVGLMCAVLSPAEQVDEIREAFRPGFDAFCAAAPEGEKHHFTDAFKPGNEPWAAVAGSVRSEFEALVRAHALLVVYDARRLAVQRQTHEANEALKADARAGRRSNRIRTNARPSSARVETQLIEGLTLKLDALAEDCGWSGIDLWFDEIDEPLAKHYAARIESLRGLSSSTHTVKGWDTEARKPVEAAVELRIHAPFAIDVARVGEIKVIGKSDPLVLVADMVANSLLRQLRALDPGAPLNAPSSIERWSLADRVWGVREGAFEDLI